VVGVGINIAPRPATGLSTPPAWLQELLPGASAAQALKCIAAPLLRDVLLFERQGFAPFAPRFAARDALLGRSIAVIAQATKASDEPSSPATDLQGAAQGVDAQGALLLRTATGMQRVTSSEVSIRPAAAGH
jgi:BirA family transcriptional regulator, biotin operon repressor / biotin---[acetyl-CoA-carboxylase] ligase